MSQKLWQHIVVTLLPSLLQATEMLTGAAFFAAHHMLQQKCSRKDDIGTTVCVKWNQGYGQQFSGNF